MALTLLTGFPGFLGTRLVRRLLADDPEQRVAALVEGRMAQRAQEVAASIDAGRIEVIPADIGERDLGLTPETYERLAAEVTVLFHLAAIYDLAVPIELAQRVNVEGTGNVLEFCHACERLDRHNYVSTAYVAGKRTGVVYEHELVMGQDFKNHYESTKFQAETWVRDRMHEVPTTIYRPAIVVGDSRTGETQKFDGPYYLLRVLSAMGDRPLAQIGRAGAPFNVVPVDFVIDALVAGAQDPAAVGATLHLVDPDPVTAHQVGDLFAELYAGRAPRFRVPAKLVQESLRSAAVRKAFGGSPRESIVYLNHPVRFDTRQASDLLARHGVRCPRFGEYAPAIVDFYKAHEDDPAFDPQAGR
ncbi:MAG TPA: SDR family oxidoreductase [Solirubrobacteraceae bacterium]|jgi:thioester reductase-like protein